jgi:bla regulator protein blaR1
MSLILYFGKVIFVSGILYSYYWFALRNKQFHLYNRFYLISTVVISLILPCINISFLNNNSSGAAKVLHVISVSGWEDAVIITPHYNWFYSFLSWQNILYALSILISCILILILTKTIYHILKIKKNYTWEKIDDIRLFYTREPQSLFSFFKNIFWNEELDISSDAGNQILRHEIYHVRKNHSFDILFLEMIKCIFWFNPFFFLVKKEIKIIHEFLADEHATSGSDKYTYAELLVWQTVNSKQIDIINTFFHNQIKRRIAMITQLKNKRYYYLSRVMVLPILLILFCAFSIRIKDVHSTAIGAVESQKTSPVGSANESSPVQPSNVQKLPAVFDTVPDKKIYSKVEVEADYPGGYKAWADYLLKTFHYPDEAINKEIKGNVVVQFIVDKDGNVGDVKAISGPKKGGLREEAVRVIKNSGKWIPAKESGHNVKAYKKQPINFMLQQQ